MEKSKIDFIAEILDNKKLSLPHKERLFLLASKEIRNITVSDTTILNRLEDLEKKINLLRVDNSKDLKPDIIPDRDNTITTPKPFKNWPLETHSPKITSDSLAKLSNDVVLRMATHSFDSLTESQLLFFPNQEFDIINFRKELEKRNKELILPTGTKTKIWSFLLNDFTKGKGWSEENVNFGWGSTELTNWCLANKGKWPATYPNISYAPGFVFPLTKTFQNNFSAHNFRDILMKFKKEIRFSQDNTFLEFLEEVSFQFSDKLNFRYNQFTGIHFYTDVEKVKQALRKILREAVSQVEENNVSNIIEYKVEELGYGKVTFSVKHIGSKIIKTKNTFQQRHLRNSEGDWFELLKDNLFSLCDLKLIADFTDGRYECNLLPNSEEMNLLSLEETPNVEFQFTFYR